MPNDSSLLIDAAHAAFIEGGVSITVAACDRANMPFLARACGCKVTGDGRVTIFVSATQAAQVLTCARDNGAVAVVFSQPSTHRTLQLKGSDAAVGPLADGDLQRIRAYREAFAQDVQKLGFAKILIRTLLSYPSGDIVALGFTPSEAFSQTPGPKAGEPLRAGA
ncbi:MAG: hypothetical protein ACM3WS_04605 [Bacillota bacterium]